MYDLKHLSVDQGQKLTFLNIFNLSLQTIRLISSKVEEKVEHVFPMHFDENNTEKIIEEILVLKKVKTYLKPFKQLQFPNILFNDPNLHQILYFFLV